MYLVAVDIGGTFTDLVAIDSVTGKSLFLKSPTTYGDFAKGIFDCFEKASIDPSDAAFIKHGTTLVINSLLQRSGARTALITTEGFRDILEIGRGNRMEPYDLRYERDTPLIRRSLRYEVDERISADGSIVTPLNVAAVERLARQLEDDGIEAVAISFINSYRNPEHENQAVAIIKRVAPYLFVSSGADLSREWYEFERTATACANSFVGVQVGDYISVLRQRLLKKGFGGALMLMGSHGGALSAESAQSKPISLVESGPVGGVIGAVALGRAIGCHNMVAFDMGGTTAKCVLVSDGEYDVESTYYIGGERRGFPIREDVIDILEVGAGGGSIASIDEQGRLSVGPQSAGSSPGPACFGFGGTEPTVTDANLLLGRLDPGSFLEGQLQLRPDHSEKAVADKICEPLGYTMDKDGMAKSAAAILTIADLTMAESIKNVSIRRGRDPRDFVLFSYGGGGGLHSVDMARELGIRHVIIPPDPSTFSAYGMLLAHARIDRAQTHIAAFDNTALANLNAEFKALEQEAESQLRHEYGERPVRHSRYLEMRYSGQMHTLKLRIDDTSGEAMRERFHTEYARRYGHSNASTPIEIVAIHSAVEIELECPAIRPLEQVSLSSVECETRAVYHLDSSSWLDTAIFRRDTLPVGFGARGPAIVDEYGASTLIGPNDHFRIGEYGEIHIDCGL